MMSRHIFLGQQGSGDFRFLAPHTENAGHSGIRAHFSITVSKNKDE